MEISVNDLNFEEEVLNSDLPVLVDFWAPWCGPCMMVGPVVEEIAREYQGKLKVCKVNVDESPITSAQYGVMSIPTLAVIKNGKIADKITGALPKDELEKLFKQHI